MKRYLKWGIAFCAILVLMLGLLAGCGEKEAATAEKVELYYNIDCEHYMGAPGIAPVRRIESDGYYHIRFAHNGEQERIPVAQEVLQKGLDFYRIVNLVFDENGVVVDFKRVDECTGGYFVDEFFVETIDGSTITCNAASTYLGYQKTFELPEDANVYYVLGDGPLVGMKTTIHVDDKITAVMDENGKITDCFVKPLEEAPAVYFNATRMYNTTTKKTTRQSDLTGTYVFEMAFNGGPVTVKTKDEAIATKMDSFAARNMVLTFDENGYVDSAVNGDTLNGNWSSWCNVLSVQDGEIETIRSRSGSNLGMKYRARMARNFVAYDVNPYAKVYGAVTELRKGDTVHCLKNSRGQIVVAFVVNRLEDCEVYWNVKRMYNSTTKETSRTPNEDGWYEILMTKDGQQYTLKTKDKDIITKIDARTDNHCALRVENGIIQGFYQTVDATGGGAIASWYDVMDIAPDGKKIGALRTYGTNIGTYAAAVLADDCKVYDVSGMGNFVGELTEIRMHDRIHGELNAEGKLGIVYVVRRMADSDMYWNVERKYNETTASTTRGKWSDGYYRVVLAVNGKQTTYKVADREVMNSIDKRPYLRSFGVDLEGDVITRVHEPALVTGGGGWASWADITSIKDGVITAVKITDSDTVKVGTVYTAKMAEDCEVYDVTELAKLDSYIGVKTKPRVGDRIYGHLNLDGEIQVLYIVGNRLAKGYLVWNVERKYDSTNKVSTRVPDENGWYKVLLAVNGKQVTWKTQDKEIIDKVDASYYMGLTVNKDGVIQGHYPYNLVTGGYVLASSSYITRISGSTITIEKPASGTTPKKTYTARMTSNCKVYNVSDSYINFIGEETKLKVGDRVAAIEGSNGRDICVLYVGYRPDIAGEPDHFHCHCGDGSASGVGEHVCDESFGWSAWINPRKLPTSGNWYLATDVTLKAGYTVAAGTTLNLCLNGHTINGSETARIYYSAGNLTVTDCKPADQQGQMIGRANVNGNVFYPGVAEEGGLLNIYGGTFKTSLEQMSKSGAIIFSGNNAAGTVQINMYGGTIQGTKNSYPGGSVYLMRGASMNMYGGTIIGGESSSGGNIYVAGEELGIYGGTISGGSVLMTKGHVTVTGGTISGGLDVQSEATIALSGNPVISGSATLNLRLSNSENVTLGDFAEGAEIYVRSTMLNVPFGTLTDPSDKAFFYSDDAEATLEMNGENQLYLKSNHTHCECGGTFDGVGEHVCDDNVGWVKWTDATKLPTTTGNYYLDTDVTLSTIHTIPVDNHVRLCFNGHTVTGPTNNYMLMIRGHVTTTDCSEPSNQGGMVAQYDIGGAVAYVSDVNGSGDSAVGVHTSMTIYAGTYRNTVATMTKSGGVFFMGGKDLGGSSVLNLYGGTIYGAKTSANGGAIYTCWDSTINMYGGTITGGDAASGGNIYAGGTGKVNIYGGSIINGKASSMGGNILMDTVDLSISGGTISGGTVVLKAAQANVTGGTISGGLDVQASSGITVSGKPVISGATAFNLRLSNGDNVTFGDLETGAEIYISGTAMNVPLGTLANAEDVEFLYGDNDNVVGVDAENRIYLKASHVHCVCGSGAFAGVGGHTCDETLGWVKWTDGTKLPTSSGNYYLDTDVTMTASQSITASVTINLCLNGHTVYGPESSWGIYTAGNMSVTDCKPAGQQGQMVGRSNSSGSVFYAGVSEAGSQLNIYAGTFRSSLAQMSKSGAILFSGNNMAGTAVTNIYGGTLQGTKNSAAGATVYLMRGATLNVYGGTITGGESTSNGGNVQIAASSAMNLYGGTITGGKAAQGGNINVDGGALTISGGTVTGGTVALANCQATVTGGNISGGLYQLSTATLALSGKPVISGNTTNLSVADGSKVTVGDLETGAAIGMTIVRSGDMVGPLTDPTDKTFFTSDVAETQLLMNEDNKLYLAVVAHEHCVCGNGASAGVGGHTCDDSVVWTKWTDGTKLPTDSGYYYLDTDVTLTAILTIPVDKHVRLCLNGHTVTGPTNTYMLMIRGHITVTDCNELSKQGGMVARYDVGGALAYVSDVNGSGDSAVGVHTSMTIYAGTYRNTVANMTKSGGVFFMGGKDLGGSSVLNLYGGTIYGTKTSVNGGAIYTCWDSTINMYGGTITGGSAATGGNIYLGGTGGINIHGGTITGGTATTGGNIYVKNLSATVAGGTISNGVAVNGGNIFFDGDSTTVYTLTVSGGTISGGQAVHEGYPTAKNGTALIYPIGGNISVNGNEKLQISGGTVENGVASHAGGNIAVNSTADLEISGGRILGGTAAYSGNIHTNNSADVVITISGGEITGGTLDTSKVNGNGPCLRLQTKVQLILSGTPKIESIYFVGNTLVDATNLGTLETPIAILGKTTSVAFATVTADLSSAFTATNGAIRYAAAEGKLYIDIG